MRSAPLAAVDIVMLGSFGVWTRGTLQSRALPLARALSTATGLRFAIVTTPWDDPTQSGIRETIDGVAIYNTIATSQRQAVAVVREQLQLLRSLRPRLVHVMKPKAAAGMTADVLARAPGRPRLLVDYDDWEGDGGWNEHGGYPLLARRLFAYQEGRLIRAADGVTAASTLLEERARRLRGESGDDVTFLPNGLAGSWMDALRDAAQQHGNHNAPRLLLYSRFAEFTPDWLADVLNRIDLGLTGPIQLDILGDGAGIQHALTGLRRLMPRRHGFVARDTLPDHLGTATIALYPYDDNLINRSKQSVKLLELMASGCAIVASDVGDIRRIGGAATTIVKPGDAGAFAAAALELINAPTRAAALGRLARDRAQAFHIDRLAVSLQGVYQRHGLL